jgi:hypothetical protein
LTSFQTSGITLVSLGLGLELGGPKGKGIDDQVYAEG